MSGRSWVGRCGCWATPTTQRTQIKQAYEKLGDALRSQRLTGGKIKFWRGICLLACATRRCHPSKQNPSLKYVIPQVVPLWTDTMVIPKTAPNPDAAYAWINFMLQPGWQPKFVNGLRCHPNRVAVEQLPPQVRNNPNLFPPESMQSVSIALLG